MIPVVLALIKACWGQVVLHVVWCCLSLDSRHISSCSLLQQILLACLVAENRHNHVFSWLMVLSSWLDALAFCQSINFRLPGYSTLTKGVPSGLVFASPYAQMSSKWLHVFLHPLKFNTCNPRDLINARGFPPREQWNIRSLTTASSFYSILAQFLLFPPRTTIYLASIQFPSH